MHHVTDHVLLSTRIQEKEWAQERLQDTRYREYMAEKEVRQSVSLLVRQ